LLFPEGEGQAILTTTFSNASNAYDSQGRLIKTPSIGNSNSTAMSNMAPRIG
jgi:hypothetical protein